MMRRVLSRPALAVVAILLGVVTPIHGQPLERGYRRVLEGNAELKTRSGNWNGDTGRATTAVGTGFHAEAQHAGVVAADFIFGADIAFQENVEAHLQFRISNEGRYGVALGAGGVRLYKQTRRVNPDLDDADMREQADVLWVEELHPEQRPDPAPGLDANVPHKVSVKASGPSLTVTVDDIRLEYDLPAAGLLAVGRFGLYVFGPENTSATFSKVRADAAVTAASNFALLYNTLGYEIAAPKRALVRTLAELPQRWLKEPRFEVATYPGGEVVADAPLTYAGRSFGMSAWEADFSLVMVPGQYVLRARVRGPGFRSDIPRFDHELVSSPFEIGTGLVTRRMMKPLALLNPEARRAADDDREKHWKVHAGVFRVSDDGIIIATGDDGYGGVMERVGNGYDSEPIREVAFTLSGEIAIDRGCDAQLQFHVTPIESYAVTLHAGAASGCPDGGAAAVRVHYEKIGGVNTPLGSSPLPNFVPGRFHRIVVRVYGDTDGTFADVDVDDVPKLFGIPTGGIEGTFALKVWAASARFHHVTAWRSPVEFLMRGGVWIPAIREPDGLMITCEEGTHIFTEDQRKRVCDPIFAQRHGFHDCNNYIAEGTSHGSFLAGLMEVWSRRGEELTDDERASLLRATVSAAGYLDELQRTAGFTGEYAHEEPSRGARTGADGYYQVQHGLYGDAALAAKGAGIDADKQLARAACVRASRATSWLMAEERRFALGHPTRFALKTGDRPWHDNLKSLVYAQLARCASREDRAVLPPMPVDELRREATRAARDWLNHLNANLARERRGAGRVIPWLEGIEEVIRLEADPELEKGLIELASRLEPQNIFHVLPQGGAEQWANQTSVPQHDEAIQAKTNPPLTWYTNAHFAASATDAAILIRHVGNQWTKKLAAGSLGWILGLNPGIPATKTVNAAPGSQPWTAAAFVSNLDAPSARGWETYMTPDTRRKEWTWPWEEAAPVHREAWLIEPKENKFMTIVNGHVIWDREWDYYNQGVSGWVSGETFLMHDGAFLKAALTYEDALAGVWPERDSLRDPSWNVSVVTSFDTTFDERSQTGWGFEDVNTVPYGYASRMAQELCRRRGYAGGRMTGHQIGERVGVLCVPKQDTLVFDVNEESINRTRWRFHNIDDVQWAQASRAAERLCHSDGSGFFTGHQIGELRGVVCAGANSAKRFAVTQQDVDEEPADFRFDDINTVSWQNAARVATNLCLKRQYMGGFFDGHQVDGSRTVVCLRPGG